MLDLHKVEQKCSLPESNYANQEKHLDGLNIKAAITDYVQNNRCSFVK